MKAVLKKLKKLKGRGPDELRVRGGQAFAAFAERRGWSSQVSEPSDAALLKLFDTKQAGRNGRVAHSPEELLEHFRTRTSPSFFASFAKPEQTREELRVRFGGSAEVGLLERANRIVEGKFDLLGLRDLNFGQPIDWHLEPVSGKRTPLVHWSRIDYLDTKVAGDKKIVWELNRHQYFMTLGRAYWRTGDERYSDVFAAHLASWMEANPPKFGINWASSLEVSFRAIAWLWALHFFKDSPRLAPALFARVLKYLYIHARHLETYLSTYFSPNTHLTGEALGLFYLGTLLPEFRAAARWRETGRRVLLEQLARHVRADGVYFEQASYYHRYTTDFYMHFLLLARSNGDALTGEVEAKLTALMEHLMFITRPDGTTPFFGDDDGGRLVVLDERAPDDFRSALATAACLFTRPDYKFVAGAASEETLWLLGGDALRGFDSLEACAPATQSRAFKEGGYFVMRDGWTSESNYLLIDCGPHGTLNCGHAHADALSFELAARGRTLLVDPGTYTYTGSSLERDWFRSSEAHNTLTIDGESSSAPSGPFSWKHTANAAPRHWTSRTRFDYFEGTHDGYTRLHPPALHTRSVLFLKGDYWIVRDRVATEGAHCYDLRFHFTTDAAPSVDAGAAVRELRSGRAGLEIFTFDRAGRWRTESGWVSRCYGERRPAPVCVFEKTGQGAQEFTTFLVPCVEGVHEQKTQACEVAADDGRAFEMLHPDARDFVICGGGELVQSGRWVTDFEWTWARFAAGVNVHLNSGSEALAEFVLLGGSRLLMGSVELFSAGGRVGHVAARRGGGRLFVETDADVDFTIATLGASVVVVNGAEFAATGDEYFRFGERQAREVEASYCPG